MARKFVEKRKRVYYFTYWIIDDYDEETTAKGGPSGIDETVELELEELEAVGSPKFLWIDDDNEHYERQIAKEFPQVIHNGVEANAVWIRARKYESDICNEFFFDGPPGRCILQFYKIPYGKPGEKPVKKSRKK